MWLWPLKMTTQKLLRLLLLLMLTIRNMLTTFCCRFGRWFGHKVRFLFILWAQGFKVWSIFWSWCSGKILKLKFGQYFAPDAWWRLWSLILVKILKFMFSRNGGVLLKFWRWGLIKTLRMKFDQDLCKNLQDLKSYFGEQNSTLGSIVSLAMFFYLSFRLLSSFIFNSSSSILVHCNSSESLWSQVNLL